VPAETEGRRGREEFGWERVAKQFGAIYESPDRRNVLSCRHKLRIRGYTSTTLMTT
jgi:hypothetical protein